MVRAYGAHGLCGMTPPGIIRAMTGIDCLAALKALGDRFLKELAGELQRRLQAQKAGCCHTWPPSFAGRLRPCFSICVSLAARRRMHGNADAGALCESLANTVANHGANSVWGITTKWEF